MKPFRQLLNQYPLSPRYSQHVSCDAHPSTDALISTKSNLYADGAAPDVHKTKQNVNLSQIGVLISKHGYFHFTSVVSQPSNIRCFRANLLFL